MSKENIKYISFALFILSFCTKKDIADEIRAKLFLKRIKEKVNKEYLPFPFDEGKILFYARLGEKKLEEELAHLKNNNT